MKTILVTLALLAAAVAPAHAQAPTQLNVGIYAPTAAFADSGARLAYVQGLAKAIQQKTGIPTTGKAYVRLDDLMKAKPDFAIIEGICIAAKSPGQVLATASIGGDTSQTWALYARTAEPVGKLKGKKLAYVKTDCRDSDFLDNTMLDTELKTKTHFGSMVDKPDVTGAVAAVKDYKTADAVFAPSSQAKGLTKLFDAGQVPNPGFVTLAKGLPGATVEQVKAAVLGYGAGGGIDGWKGAASYGGLSSDLAAKIKRAIFAPPEVVRMEDQDVLVLPQSEYATATVKQHFWEPVATAP